MSPTDDAPAPSDVGIEHLMRFTTMLVKFQAVVRHDTVPGREAKLNDAEHSYMLAMMAWYLIEALQLDLDLALVLKLCLTHDLPEVYAGDQHIFDHAGRVGKSERERAAFEQLAAEFPEAIELLEFIYSYEHRPGAERDFVHALDKLMPMVIIYLSDGGTWHELGFDRDELLDFKRRSTAGDPVVSRLSAELEILIRGRPKLFSNRP